MTQTDQAIATLATRLKLDEKAARRLPNSLDQVAKELNVTPDEVVKLCHYAPPLMDLIQTKCRQRARK